MALLDREKRKSDQKFDPFTKKFTVCRILLFYQLLFFKIPDNSQTMFGG